VRPYDNVLEARLEVTRAPALSATKIAACMAARYLKRTGEQPLWLAATWGSSHWFGGDVFCGIWSDACGWQKPPGSAWLKIGFINTGTNFFYGHKTTTDTRPPGANHLYWNDDITWCHRVFNKLCEHANRSSGSQWCSRTIDLRGRTRILTNSDEIRFMHYNFVLPQPHSATVHDLGWMVKTDVKLWTSYCMRHHCATCMYCLLL
jgi:hypothetical protein